MWLKPCSSIKYFDRQLKQTANNSKKFEFCVSLLPFHFSERNLKDAHEFGVLTPFI
jgi:hypothetical protein